MRELTIKRNKSFVGCIAKMKIFIEDVNGRDLVINGVHCTQLGDLKNGEEKTFIIGEGQAKVFVIADSLSKGFCNEFYQLPEGQENIFLSGKNKFNPVSGNAFRFDNNDSAEAQQNRKRNIKRGAVVLCVAFAYGLFIGFAISGTALLFTAKYRPMEFSNSGMSITLTREFDQTEIEQFTTCYISEDVEIFIQKNEFELFEGLESLTAVKYADLLLENSNLSVPLKNPYGLVNFDYEYTDPETNITYKYRSFVYKADDAFWLVQFATPTEIADEYDESILEWAQSVSFE